MTSTSLPHTNVFTPNHYNGRNGYTVDHITLHIMVGTLSGTDTVFMNPNYRASSHYGIGSNGDIHQYVDEDNGSWADGDMASDCSGITIEHEGGSPSIRCTDACVEASAQLCADISRRYNLGFLKHDGLNGNVYLACGQGFGACKRDFDRTRNTTNQGGRHAIERFCSSRRRTRNMLF